MDVSSLLLLVFGFGAIVGPLVAGLVVARFGYASVFLCIAAAEISLALHLLAQLLGKRAVSEEQKARISELPPLTHGTQALVGLNPGYRGRWPLDQAIGTIRRLVRARRSVGSFRRRDRGFRLLPLRSVDNFGIIGSG